MEDLILINDVEKRDSLNSVVYRNIRELGVKLPKVKKLNKLNQSRRSISAPGLPQQDDKCGCKIFGEPLCSIPTSYLPNYGYVPEFLVESYKIIDEHVGCEGIFRKSGSLSRQKELKLAVDEGKSLNGANVFDTAVLIKQFFRELPEPLFLTVYLDAFIRCYQLPPDKDPKKAILQLCLLLPLENTGALRYTMHMLSRVASVSDKNKMTANNLALIMAPNIMHSNKGNQKMSSSEEKLLHIQTYIVELLIKNWEHIGMVSRSLQLQMGLVSECVGADDDLYASDDNTLEDSKDVSKKIRRKRSGSLTDLVSSIAHGLAKLRRSTDGKSANMSLNSSQKGELSITCCQPNDQPKDIPADAVTPCVMRKRRASGENATAAFSTMKKQAILGYLPQKSALASTPFTPSSTVRKKPDNGMLNATTPAMGSKTARKKLSLFISPGSKTKVKKEASTTQESPPALRTKSVKSKNIFKRLSGSRSEKVTDSSGEFLTEDSLPRSVSSPTLLDSDFRSSAVSSVVSSASSDTTSLQSLLSTDSLLSLESHMSHEMSELTPAANVSPDSGKGSMLGEASYCSTIPSQLDRAQDESNIHCPEDGVWVTCKVNRHDENNANKNLKLKSSNGLILLCENYTTASEEEDSSHGQGIPNSRHRFNTITQRANLLRKKSVSAEDLPSACVASKLPVRAQSMCVLTGKKFNFKPRLEISRQTHNLLARAGYIQAIETDANDVQLPVKSPKRSNYGEEMMLTLRSSFHERHVQNNISVKSLRAFPDSSSISDQAQESNFVERKHLAADHYEPSAVAKKNNVLTEPDNLFHLQFEEKHSKLRQKDATDLEVDITGLDVTVSDSNVTDTEVDVTGVDVDSSVDNAKTDLDRNKNNACESKSVGTELDVIDSEAHLLVNDGGLLKDDENRCGIVECSVIEKEVNATSVKVGSVSNDKSLFGTEQKGSCGNTDVVTPEPGDEVHVVSPDSAFDISVSKHKVKDIKAALTLSGIFDQDVAQQVQIKRAEVLHHKRDSIINVQRTGHVAQSIKQFSQSINSDKDQGLVKSLIPKRGTSPVRIPTIFTKSKELKSPLKETTTNIQSVLADGGVLENVILQGSVKTPHRLLPPHILKPLHTPSSARNHRPQIKRLRAQHSPRKIIHKSPKLTSPIKSPSVAK